MKVGGKSRERREQLTSRVDLSADHTAHILHAEIGSLLESLQIAPATRLRQNRLLQSLLLLEPIGNLCRESFEHLGRWIGIFDGIRDDL